MTKLQRMSSYETPQPQMHSLSARDSGLVRHDQLEKLGLPVSLGSNFGARIPLSVFVSVSVRQGRIIARGQRSTWTHNLLCDDPLHIKFILDSQGIVYERHFSLSSHYNCTICTQIRHIMVLCILYLIFLLCFNFSFLF